MATIEHGTDKGPGVSLLYNPRVRGVFFQVLTIGIVFGGLFYLISNVVENRARQNKPFSFDFLDTTAGFSIAQTPIPYSETSSYWDALVVGLLNTAIVAVLGIIFATLLGFLVGVARLSSNWVVAKIATAYVEIVRNVPLLLQMFFWYFGVISTLPNPRDSLEIKPLAWLAWPIDLISGGTAGTSLLQADKWVLYLNNRGFIAPHVTLPSWEMKGLGLLVVAAIVVAWIIRRLAKARQMRTGQIFPSGWVSLALIVGLPLVYIVLNAHSATIEFPAKTRFNLAGGVRIIPELVALTLALTVYTGAFIGETVRAGILAVSHGQTEAARSLGVSEGRTLQLVVIPQAMRVIIPPLTSQYLNLTKNSSLAVAIGYPDLVYTGGTVLNQSAREVEVIAIFMAVYLGTSLLTSFAMNVFNARMAIVER